MNGDKDGMIKQNIVENGRTPEATADTSDAIEKAAEAFKPVDPKKESEKKEKTK